VLEVLFSKAEIIVKSAKLKDDGLVFQIQRAFTLTSTSMYMQALQ